MNPDSIPGGVQPFGAEFFNITPDSRVQDDAHRTKYDSPVGPRLLGDVFVEPWQSPADQRRGDRWPDQEFSNVVNRPALQYSLDRRQPQEPSWPFVQSSPQAAENIGADFFQKLPEF